MQTFFRLPRLRMSTRVRLTPIELAIALSIVAVLVPLTAQDDVVVAADAGSPAFVHSAAMLPARCGFPYTDASAISTAVVSSAVVTSGC
jgi:hypothetical protein